MKKIRLTSVLIICFALSGLIEAQVSGEESPSTWCIRIVGGVYHMISFPYIPQDGDVLADLVDDLGPYNTTQWRFFRYDSARSSYIERPDEYNFGWGYWIISRNTRTICVEGEPVVGDQVILEHGGDRWNQIGNIFDYDFPIASLYAVRANDPDPLLNRVQLIDAVNNDLTYVTLQEFENGAYIDIPANGKNMLEVGKGYWLRVAEGVGEPVILWFVVRGPNLLSEEIYLSEEFFERVVQQEVPPAPPPGIETSSSSSAPLTGSSGGGGGGCFIATAAYGSGLSHEVKTLKKFRDTFLLANELGRTLVSAYYKCSPFAADFISKHPIVRRIARIGLYPLLVLSKWFTEQGSAK